VSPSEGGSGDLSKLRQEEYRQRLLVNRLRREVYRQEDPSASPDLLKELTAAEQKLRAVEQKRAEAQAKAGSGLIVGIEKDSRFLGAQTTGLEAEVHVRMEYLPTAIYHLLDRDEHPLVTCRVRVARGTETRRLRLTSFIEGYSARAVDTYELEPKKWYTFKQLPTLFRDRIGGVTELTRATLNVALEDLDGEDGGLMELHKTEPVWLLARTAAPRKVRDPKSGEWLDLSRYWGAFVTPNAPSVMEFLSAVADECDGPLDGYLGTRQSVESQVRAVFKALKKAGITYVHSATAFNPDEASTSQRMRLPSESLARGQANCIDGTLLFASLLEAITLSPGIVVFPTHALVAWESWDRDREDWDETRDGWRYLETTMIENFSFERARRSGASQVRESSENVLWPLRELRSEEPIVTPME
jgi:hypothetical protein